MRQWRAAGYGRTRIVRGLLRRALPPILPQIAIIAVSITGAAVAVETVFAVPGLGRTALDAADAQDLPLLQACMAILIAFGFAGGVAARAASRRMAGPVLAESAVPFSARSRRRGRRLAWIAATAGPLLAAVAIGLTRTADAVDTGARLAGPSRAHPLGTDALGRDVLARLGHGALWTVGAAVCACALAYLIALALGFAPRLAHPLAEAVNSFPEAIAGILVVVVIGRGQLGAVVAITAVSWPPLAAHAAELVAQARAAGHLEARRALGAGPVWTLRRHVLPLVAGPLASHAGMRLPGMALGIASSASSASERARNPRMGREPRELPALPGAGPAGHPRPGRGDDRDDAGGHGDHRSWKTLSRQRNTPFDPEMRKFVLYQPHA
ncbi:hypothetical protein GCM10029992_27120 [Glycomyces albus]